MSSSFLFRHAIFFETFFCKMFTWCSWKHFCVSGFPKWSVDTKFWSASIALCEQCNLFLYKKSLKQGNLWWAPTNPLNWTSKAFFFLNFVSAWFEKPGSWQFLKKIKGSRWLMSKKSLNFRPTEISCWWGGWEVRKLVEYNFLPGLTPRIKNF